MRTNPSTTRTVWKAAAPYVHPRMATAEPRHLEPDFVPLAERLKAYARRDAIEAGDSKVVKLKL